jgi:hypothetical protein
VGIGTAAILQAGGWKDKRMVRRYIRKLGAQEGGRAQFFGRGVGQGRGVGVRGRPGATGCLSTPWPAASRCLGWDPRGSRAFYPRAAAREHPRRLMHFKPDPGAEGT